MKRRWLYESPTHWEQERIHAVVLYCSDGRFGEQFDDFSYNYLRLFRYDRLAIPGGPAELARGTNPALQHHMQFLLDAHQLERVVLIQHQACAYYGQYLGVSPERIEAVQREDLLRATDAIRRIDPKLMVEAYLAQRDESHVGFENVELVSQRVAVGPA
jgi:hypothetical protein